MDLTCDPYRNKSMEEYGHLFVMDFEKNFDEVSWSKWFKRNWIIKWIVCFLYVRFIFIFQDFMSRRNGFDARLALTIWSSTLAIFSIFGTIRAIPDLINQYIEGGFYNAICFKDHNNVVSRTWELFFVLSKLFELGDTIFVILRKQKLLFLHYYHHLTVLLFTWYTYDQSPSTCVMFGTMNYFIHSIMYSYYALKAMKVPISRQVSIVITSLQILQMAIGLFITIYVYNIIISGIFCDTSMEVIFWAGIMYLSYFILFGHFFIQNYIEKLIKAQQIPKGWIICRGK